MIIRHLFLLLLHLLSIQASDSADLPKPVEELPFFSKCHLTICMQLAGERLMRVSTKKEESYDRGGFQIDDREDAMWRVTIVFESNKPSLDVLTFHKNSFEPIEFICDQDAEFTKNNIKFSYVQNFYKGNLAYYKFTLTALNEAKSMYDALRLYEHADSYYVSMKTRDGQGTFDGSIKTNDEPSLCRSEFGNVTEHEPGVREAPRGVGQRPTVFQCNTFKEKAMLNKKMVGGGRVFCGSRGWYDSKGAMIAPYEEHQRRPYCINRCDSYFLPSSGVMGANGALVKPFTDNRTDVTSCKAVLGSVEIRGEVYDELRCADEGWVAAGGKVIEDRESIARINVECFGTFMFMNDNCKGDEGCAKLIYDKGVITCPAGYSLLLNKVAHPKLSITGKQWMVEGTSIGPVDKNSKPTCISKCLPSYFTSAANSKAQYTYDGKQNTGKVSCGDGELITSELRAGENFENLECDSRHGLLGDGTLLKDFSASANPDALKFSAGCFQKTAIDKSESTMLLVYFAIGFVVFRYIGRFDSNPNSEKKIAACDSVGFIDMDVQLQDLVDCPSVVSDPTTVEGLPWDLSVQRYGKDELDVSLNIINSNVSPCWTVDVRGTIKVLNRVSPADSIVHDLSCKYDANRKMSPAFLVNRDILNNGFLVNDSVRVQTTFTVVDMKGLRSSPSIDFTNPENPCFDVCLVVEGSKLYAGKQILAAHSSVFHSMFYSDFIEKKEIELKDVKKDEFLVLLRLVYAGMVAGGLVTNEIRDNNVEIVLKMADRFGVTSVLEKCETHLMSNECEMETIELFWFADKNKLTMLQDYVIKSLKTVKEISDLEGYDVFTDLSAESHAALLRRVFEINAESSKKKQM